MPMGIVAGMGQLGHPIQAIVIKLKKLRMAGIHILLL
jgi:hypothetical protein